MLNPSGHPAAPRSPDGEVTFRLSALQIALPVLVGTLVGSGLVYAAMAATSSPIQSTELINCLAAAAIATVVTPLLSRRYGVSLTGDVLIVLGDRRSQIPRDAIHGLEVRSTLGVRQVSIILKSGGRTSLRAPMSFADRRFEDKVRILDDWCREGP
ncbi:hypothetical protein [Streptomyces sp. SYSU K217416]